MRLTYKIDKSQPLREFISALEISDKLLSDIKKYGDLRVNNQHVTIRYLLNEFDCLEIVFPPEVRGLQLEPEDIPLDIVYEDEYLLVINKPPLLACIPDHRYHHHTLANRIIAYYEKIGLESTVHFVNRLDRETSGLLIVAKYRYIHNLFTKYPSQRSYLAVVPSGIDDQVITLPIGRENNNVRRQVMADGKDSLTTCHVLKTEDQWSLVECNLKTGRTHQIRVHLAAVGFALIGDSLYGGATNLAKTYYLHSYCVCFVHPITKVTLQFVCERPITQAIYPLK